MQRAVWIERLCLACSASDEEEMERWMGAVVGVLVSPETVPEVVGALAIEAPDVPDLQPETAADVVDVLAARVQWPHGRVADRLPATLDVLRQATAGHVPWDEIERGLPSGVVARGRRHQSPVALPASDGHDLASGRPGSRSPLSSGRPHASQRDSIAASSDPRAARKLSSGRADQE